MLADPFEAEFLDLGRMSEVHLALHVGEAAGGGDRLEHVVRVGVERLGDGLGLGLRIFDLVRRGVDAGALFGAGELLSVTVEDRSAKARNGDRGHLLGSRLGSQRVALYALEPEGPQKDAGEKDEPEEEEETDATLWTCHGALAPVGCQALCRRGDVAGLE